MKIYAIIQYFILSLLSFNCLAQGLGPNFVKFSNNCIRNNYFYEFVRETPKFVVVKVRTKDVPQFLKCKMEDLNVVNENTSLLRSIERPPVEVQGLYWMKGNPMPDTYALVDSKEICVYGSTQWTLYPNIFGNFLHRFTEIMELTYKFDFSNRDNWSIVPYFKIFGREFHVPKAVMEFSAQRNAQGEENLWKRRNWIAGLEVMGYDLYKVIDKDGITNKTWTESLKLSPEFVHIAVGK